MTVCDIEHCHLHISWDNCIRREDDEIILQMVSMEINQDITALAQCWCNQNQQWLQIWTACARTEGY